MQSVSALTCFGTTLGQPSCPGRCPDSAALGRVWPAWGCCCRPAWASPAAWPWWWCAAACWAGHPPTSRLKHPRLRLYQQFESPRARSDCQRERSVESCDYQVINCGRSVPGSARRTRAAQIPQAARTLFVLCSVFALPQVEFISRRTEQTRVSRWSTPYRFN